MWMGKSCYSPESVENPDEPAVEAHNLLSELVCTNTALRRAARHVGWMHGGGDPAVAQRPPRVDPTQHRQRQSQCSPGDVVHPSRVCRAPELVVRRRGRIRQVPEDHPDADAGRLLVWGTASQRSIEVWALYPPHRHVSRKVSAFIRMLTEQFVDGSPDGFQSLARSNA